MTRLEFSGVRSLAVCLLCAAMVFPAHAAQDPTISSRRSPAISRDMRYREWVLKELERRGKEAPEQQRLAWERIREDFRRLQIENNALRDATLAAAFDQTRAEKSVAEIGRRATRLNSELGLPEAEEDEQGSQTRPAELQIRTLISALDGVITRFVKNAVFDESAVLDVTAAVKAKRDLERIIDLSRELKRRFRKADGKN